MKPGDVAGLALFNFPYVWIGIKQQTDSAMVEQFDQTTSKTTRVNFKRMRIWLRAHCDFLTEKARFSYSADGKEFEDIGAHHRAGVAPRLYRRVETAKGQADWPECVGNFAINRRPGLRGSGRDA
jgi:beta-xylosidase-like protein